MISLSKYFWILCVVMLCFIPVVKADAGRNDTIAFLLGHVDGLPEELQEEILEHLFLSAKERLRLSISKKPYKSRTSLLAHRKAVYSLAFSPDGKLLATGSVDKEIHLWDTQSRKKVRTLLAHPDRVYEMTFSPDSSMLASSMEDGQVNLWSARTGEILQTIQADPTNGRLMSSLCFRPDGKQLACGSWDGTITLWDVQTGNLMGTLKGHRGKIYTVTYSPDGKKLVSGSEDCTIKVWNTETGQEAKTLEGHDCSVTSVVFYPTNPGVLISCSHDGTIQKWNIHQGVQLEVPRKYLGHLRSVFCNPDNQVIHFSWGEFGGIGIRDEATGREACIIKRMTGPVQSVALRSDGKQLAVGYLDGCVEIRDQYDQEEQEALGCLDGSLYQLRPSQKFLLYVLDAIPGEKNLADLETKLKQQFGSQSPLLNFNETYDNLPDYFRPMVKECFDVEEPSTCVVS